MKNVLNHIISDLLFVVACGLILLSAPLNWGGRALVFAARHLSRHFTAPDSSRPSRAKPN